MRKRCPSSWPKPLPTSPTITASCCWTGRLASKRCAFPLGCAGGDQVDDPLRRAKYIMYDVKSVAENLLWTLLQPLQPLAGFAAVGIELQGGLVLLNRKLCFAQSLV